MQKWEKINREELEEIILNSKTKAEALQKMGYIGTGHTKIINKISEKCNIDISHLEKESIIKKKFGMLKVIQATTQKIIKEILNIFVYVIAETILMLYAQI